MAGLHVDGVFGLLHRPECQPGQDPFFWFSLQFLQECLQGLGVNVPALAPLDAMAHIIDKGIQGANLFRIRLLMGAIYKGDVAPIISCATVSLASSINSSMILVAILRS